MSAGKAVFAESVFEGERGSTDWYLNFLWHKLIELPCRSTEELDFPSVRALSLSFSHLKKKRECLFVVQFGTSAGNVMAHAWSIALVWARLHWRGAWDPTGTASEGCASKANSCCIRGVQVMWFGLQLPVLGTNDVEITCHKQFFLVHLLRFGTHSRSW